MYKFPTMLTSAFLATTMLSPVVSAQSNDELKQQVSDLTERLAGLETLVQKLTAAGAEVPVSEKRAVPEKTVKFSSSDPAPTLTSEDGAHQFNVRGRIFADWSTGSDDNGTMDFSGTKLRAAWFGVEGKAAANIKYKFEADFGGDNTRVKDAYLQFKNGSWSYTIGQSKVPISLEWLTAISQTTFMERGAFKSAFGFGRAMGIKAGTSGDGWTFTAGVFQGDNVSAGDDATEGWQAAARATYGSELENGTWLLGLSGRMRNTNDEGALSYRAKGITNQSGTLTSVTGTSKDQTVNLEAALTLGSFFTAAEYTINSAQDTGSAGRDAIFTGGYLEAGYIITGEKRPLSLKKGAWGRPKVSNPVGEGGMGMWMLSARYDMLDLTDNGAFGGEQENYVLSLSWYMTRYIRAMMDYGHSSVSDLALSGSNKADVVGLRIGVDW